MKILFLLSLFAYRNKQRSSQSLNITKGRQFFFCLRVNKNSNLLVFPPSDTSNFSVRIDGAIFSSPHPLLKLLYCLFVCFTGYSQTDTPKSINGPGSLVSPTAQAVSLTSLAVPPATIEFSGPSSSENAL